MKNFIVLTDSLKNEKFILNVNELAEIRNSGVGSIVFKKQFYIQVFLMNHLIILANYFAIILKSRSAQNEQLR